MRQKELAGKKISYESLDKMRLCGILDIPPTPNDFALMMHGITEDKDEWQGFYVDMANELHKHDIATLRFDFRGHGESNGSSLDISVVGDVLDIKASMNLIQNHWRKKIALIATSFGAGPALLAAVQMQDKIKLIVLVAPVIDYEATFLHPRTEWTKSSFSEEAFKELPKRAYLLLDKQYRLSPKLIEEFHIIKPYEILGKLRIPILIIHGEKDSMVPFDISERHAYGIQLIRFVPLRGADHGYVDAEDENGNAPKSIRNKERIFREIIRFFKENN